MREENVRHPCTLGDQLRVTSFGSIASHLGASGMTGTKAKTGSVSGVKPAEFT